MPVRLARIQVRWPTHNVADIFEPWPVRRGRAHELFARPVARTVLNVSHFRAVVRFHPIGWVFHVEAVVKRAEIPKNWRAYKSATAVVEVPWGRKIGIGLLQTPAAVLAAG